MKYNLHQSIQGAPDFKWYEFFRSETALRKGIYNIPKEDYIWDNIQKLASNVLQPCRDKFGKIRINSGYRCLKLNREIGSSDHSNHVYGLAADIEPLKKGISLLQVLEFIHYNLDYKELIAEFYPDGWNHVAYQEDNNKRELKLMDENHSYDLVSINYIQDLYEV